MYSMQVEAFIGVDNVHFCTLHIKHLKKFLCAFKGHLICVKIIPRKERAPYTYESVRFYRCKMALTLQVSA
jgi:hypothetical protein